MNRFLTIFLSFLLLITVRAAHAAGELEFSQGVMLYKKGIFAEAAAKFEAAYTEGMREPKLDFNLALCNLKLQRYDTAHEYFLQAAKYRPLQPLAYFNIGLLELERGNNEKSREWFQQVSESASEPKLRALANLKLEQLSDAVPAAVAASWDNGYSISLGYDDNIEDPAFAGTTNKGDSFANAMVYFTRTQGDDNNLRMGLIGFIQHYKVVSVFDLELLQLMLDKGFVSGSWNNKLGTELETSSLGGREYLKTVKLYLGGQHPLTPMDKLRLRYRYSTISSALQSYDYLSGSRHEMEFRWQHRRQDLRLQASYELEVNERNDYSGTTIFSSYSPTRHTIDLRVDANWTSKLALDGRIIWRASNYNDANVLADSSRITRRDDSLSLGLGLDYAMADDLKLEFKYKFTENHSNISTHHYTRNIYSLGFKGTF